MRLAKTIVLGFSATLLLLLAHAWSPLLITYVWMTGVYVLLFGGWVWLVVTIGGEFFRDRRLKLASIVFPAIFGSILLLTWWFDIFPYAWYAWASLLLVGCVAWRCLCDYGELFRRRPKAAAPQNWHALEQGQIPASSADARQHAKAHFARSYDVKITCRPRAGPMGLINQPLEMDE